MKHFKLDTLSKFEEKKLCLAIGNFDGFHKGHQAIIRQVKDISLKKNLSSAIMSFNPHPRTFFNKSNENFNIYTKEEKLIFLKEFNIDIYIDFEFNINLSQLTPEDFVKNILVDKLNITNLVVGSEFRFGKDRKGNVSTLNDLSKKNNYNVHLVDSIMLKDMSSKYSSSIIRKKITEGKIEDVTNSLGRQWYMKGIVIEGQKKARDINFPTANISPGNHILPKKGVYAVDVIFNNKTYLGISNFGLRPTVDGTKLLLETHLFNFDQEIYGKELTVRFHTFIRPEVKFSNFKELTKQIKKDVEKAKKYHQL